MQDAMKIAVFEPYPRTCGVTAWAFELARGFRDLGHQADVVSCTKSGRPRSTATRDGRPRTGWQWWGYEPDRTLTWDDAPSALDAYDLVVLNEPKNNPLDAPARRENEKTGRADLPEYLEVLRRTRTPWVTAFHDETAYRADKAPFLEACLTSGNFTGLAVECRPGAYRAAAYAAAGHVTRLLSWPWLPYATRHAEANFSPVASRPPVVGMTGRVVSTKGFTAVLSVAADAVTPPHELRLYGSESGGHAPCQTFTWFEALVMHHGWNGLRGDPTRPSAVRTEHSVSIGNFSPTNTVVPFGMRHPGTGAVFRYMGAYRDRTALYDGVQVVTMLTARNLATTLEYTALEALDAGCVVLAPRYAVENTRGADYDLVWVDYERGVRLAKDQGFVWHDPAERVALADALRRAVDLVPTYDPAKNRERLDTYHAPRHLARALLEAL